MIASRPLAEGARLDRDLVRVRLLDPGAVTAERLATHLGLLSAPERRRAEALPLARVRHEHLCTRVLQRLMLSDLVPVDPADWRFVARSGGRPEIATPAEFRNLRFNLSHTTSLIACAAVPDLPVGIDAEHIDNAADVEALASRFFAGSEAEAINRLDPEHRRWRFLQYWTLKEACYKALGTGLTMPMHALRIETIDDSGIGVAFGPEIGSHPDRWQFQCGTPTPRHLLGLAIMKGGRPDLAIAIDWSVPF